MRRFNVRLVEPEDYKKQHVGFLITALLLSHKHLLDEEQFTANQQPLLPGCIRAILQMKKKTQYDQIGRRGR